MKKRTTTQKLQQVIIKNLLHVVKAECYYKASRKTEIINNDTLIENLQFLSESGVFSGCIGWTFEKDFKTDGYIAECSRTDGNSENIVTVYFCADDGGVKCEDVEKTLIVEESEE